MNHKHSSFLDPKNTDAMDIHYIQCSTAQPFLHVKNYIVNVPLFRAYGIPKYA